MEKKLAQELKDANQENSSGAIQAAHETLKQQELERLYVIYNEQCKDIDSKTEGFDSSLQDFIINAPKELLKSLKITEGSQLLARGMIEEFLDYYEKLDKTNMTLYEKYNHYKLNYLAKKFHEEKYEEHKTEIEKIFYAEPIQFIKACGADQNPRTLCILVSDDGESVWSDSYMQAMLSAFSEKKML
jgi:hypothetical protein